MPSAVGRDRDRLVGQRARRGAGRSSARRPSASPRRCAARAPATPRDRRRPTAAPRSCMKPSPSSISPSSSRPGIGLPYGDSVGWSQQLDQAALDRLGHDVLPAAGLRVDELPVETDHVGEQPLGESVLAHDPGGEAQALVGELEVTIALDGHQAVALHPRDRLRDRRVRSGAAARRSGRAAGRCPPRRARRSCGGTSRWCRSGRSRGHSYPCPADPRPHTGMRSVRCGTVAKRDPDP